MRKSYISTLFAMLLVLLSGCSDSAVEPDFIFSLKDREGKEPQVVYSLSVSAQSLDFGYSASSQSLTITTNDDWDIACSSDWLSVSQDKGSSSQSINVEVLANNATAERSATITVRGVNSQKEILVNVRQEASASTIKVDKDYFTIDDMPVVLEANVTAEDSWTVSCEESWILVSPTSGTGSQRLNIEVLENSSAEQRTGSITIKGKTETDIQVVTIEQKGKYLDLSEDMLSFTSEGGSSTVTVSTTGTYQYSCEASWVSVSLEGNSITITVPDNNGTQPRSARVLVSLAGCDLTKEISIVQSGISLMVDKTSISANGDEDSSHTITISTEQGWTASSDVDWISVSPSSGNGDATLTIGVTANPEKTERSGVVAIKADDGNEVRILITQSGASYLDLSEDMLSFTSEGGSSTVTVSTVGTYQYSCDASWVTVSRSGSSLKISVSRNNSTKPRSATVSVTLDGSNITKEITVEQSGISLIVDKTSISASGDEDSSHTITISTEQGWTAFTDVDWITVSPSSGNGDATLNIGVVANPEETERKGTITVKVTDGNEISIQVTQTGTNLNSITIKDFNNEVNWG